MLGSQDLMVGLVIALFFFGAKVSSDAEEESTKPTSPPAAGAVPPGASGSLMAVPAGRSHALTGAGLALFSAATLAAVLLTDVASVEAASPTETLRALYVEANQIIGKPHAEGLSLDSLAAIRALFSNAFDSRGAAERALGREWQAHTAAEKSAFTSLFAGFVQRGFIVWLASVAAVDGNGGGMRINYLGETVDHDHATVRTAIESRGGRVVPLTYEMSYRDRGWLVSDVMIDGISLVANYRAQFDRVVRTWSYRELINRMRQRITGDLPQPTSAAPEGHGAVQRSPGSVETS